ncbi:MAG: shikimate kinase [Fusobacteriaceae bacterium]
MKENIALIGLMGSGKTTIGRQLAKVLEMRFIDTDKMISMCEKKTVTEIFQKHGERYFRDLERKIIAEESRENNIIISTGGGAIVDNENIKNLKKTSFVVYLDSSLECIHERVKNGKNRPLLNDVVDLFATIKDLHEKRDWLYRISSDYILKIDINSDIYDTVNVIKEAYINS